MAQFSENKFIDTATNKWISSSTNSFETGYVNLYTEIYFNQIYGLSEEKFIHQDYALLHEGITRHIVQVWATEIMTYCIQTWGDASTVEKIINQYWWDAAQPTRYIKQEWGDMRAAVKVVHQVYSLLHELTNHVDQNWALTGSPVEQYVNQLWNLEERNFVQRAFNQIFSLVADSQVQSSSDSYETDSTSGTYDSVTYPVAVTNDSAVTETWTVTFTDATNFTVSGSTVGSVGSGTVGTDFSPTNPKTNEPYFVLDSDGWGGTWADTETLSFATYQSSHNVTFSMTLGGQTVFSPAFNIELDEGRATIDAQMEIVNPNYFGLCVQNNPATITVGNTTYNFIIRGVSTSTQKAVTRYSLTLQSPVSILNANSTPLMQKEFDEGLASDIMQELADQANLTVDWQVYHNGYLVDWTIPQGELFANNEKPLAVMRKITEACGGAIQSKPDGNLEILHEFPDRVEDWATAAPTYILNNLVNFETISSSDEEKSGVNTIYVSDQSTADKSYTLEEEEISATRKYVHGYHTPWDFTEVWLDHSSDDATVTITYRGVEEPVEPPYTDDEGETVEPELVEIIEGQGSVSKPIYEIISTEYVKDVLGAITFSEDGSLTTETVGESLIKVRYRTKHHVWEVYSPSEEDVQCILRFVDA